MSVAGAMAGIFDGINSDIADTLRGLGQMIQGMQSVAQAQASGDYAGAAIAGAQTGAQTQQTLGIGRGDLGTSSFGGDLGGDFADTGAEVGGAIGAVFGGPVGALVGGALGAAIGSMINRGVDEGLVSATAEAGRIVASIDKDEAELASHLVQITDGINAGLDAISAALGEEINVSSIEFSLKLRGEEIIAFINGQRLVFESVEQAINEIFPRVLAEADTGGLSPEIRAAIENSVAKTVDEIEHDLNIAATIRDLRLGETQVQVRNTVDSFLDLMAEGQRLGIDVAPVAEQMGVALGDLRDQITGTTKSIEEQKKSEQEQFNAAVKLAKADLEVQRAELIAKGASAQVTAASAEAIAAEASTRIAATDAVMLAADGYARSMVGVADVTAATASVAAGSAAALADALSAVDAAIAALPDLISDAEIQAAIRRAQSAASGARGGGGGPSRADRRDAFEERAREVDEAFEGVASSTRDLADELAGLEEWIDSGRRLGVAEERLSELRSRSLDLIESDLLERWEQQGDDASGAFARVLGEAEGLFEHLEILAAERAAAAGTTIETELARLTERAGEPVTAALSEALREDFEALSEAGDVAGLRRLREMLEGVDLPPGLVEILADMPPLVWDFEKSLEAATESFSGTVRTYLDMVRGISEEERKLAGIREEFAAARERLSGLAEGDPAAEVDPAAARVEKAVVEGLERIRDQAETIFQTGKIAPEGARLSDTLADPADKLGRASDDAAESMDGLRAQIDALAQAEALAIQQLGIEFIDSLTALGVSLPTPLVLELAHAQFELAQAEAIAAATALAAAGAFEGMSIGLEELLELIAGASFEASQFAPSIPRPTASAPDRDDSERELESIRGRLEDTIEAWNRAPLGEVTRRALGMTDQLKEMRDAAREAEISLGPLNTAFRVAADAFVDETLRPFEDIGLSSSVIELRDLREQFADITRGFIEIGATADQWERLEMAQQNAFANFWERQTQPIADILDDLRASDPRRAPEEQFLEDRDEFRDIAARAQAGDLAAVAQLGEAGRDLLAQSASFLGQADTALRDEVAAALEAVMGLGPEDFDPVASAVDDQTIVLEDIRDILSGRPVSVRPGTPRATARRERVVGRAATAIADRAQVVAAPIVVRQPVIMPEIKAPTAPRGDDARALEEYIRASDRQKDRERRIKDDTERRAMRAEIEHREQVTRLLRAQLAQSEALAIEIRQPRGISGGGPR